MNVTKSYIYVQVNLKDIDTLFHQISQNMTADYLSDCTKVYLNCSLS